MGKGLKEFQLYDSRRLRKKPQDAQDDVTELFDLFDAHFWGWKGIQKFGLPKAVTPNTATLRVGLCMSPGVQYHPVKE